MTTTNAESVLRELRVARKHRSGLSEVTMADCPTTCSFLGAGDPAVAFSSLVALARTYQLDQETSAGLMSLGIGIADSVSVLDRLERIAAEQYVDQRTARRRADQGLRRLAMLITTNWSLWPPKMIVRLRHEGDALLLAVGLEWPVRLSMLTPTIEVAHKGDPPEAVEGTWETHRTRTKADWELRHLGGVLALNLQEAPTVVTIRWLGEMWPRFDTNATSVEALSFSTWGNQYRLSIGRRHFGLGGTGERGGAGIP